MQHSKTSTVVGSSGESLASGTSSFGRCVTNVGWMSVGSTSFSNTAPVTSKSSNSLPAASRTKSLYLTVRQGGVKSVTASQSGTRVLRILPSSDMLNTKL